MSNTKREAFIKWIKRTKIFKSFGQVWLKILIEILKRKKSNKKLYCPLGVLLEQYFKIPRDADEGEQVLMANSL